MEQFSIGVVGTAKNTGKTTTVLELLDACRKKERPAGLMGIGYDGEDLDNITGLPKPNYLLQPGITVASAEECLLNSHAPHEVLAHTGIISIFGEILIARITGPGKMILAGPNQAEGISRVLHVFKKMGIEFVLIDGSINRVIPLMKAASVIFATGASRSTDPDFLAKEIEAIRFIFCLECFIQNKLDLPAAKRITIVSSNGEVRSISGNSICSTEALERLMKCIDEFSEFVFIPGILFFKNWKEILPRFEKKIKGKSLIFSSPGHILISGEPVLLMEIIKRIRDIGCRICVLKSIPISAVTVNPFYPKKKDISAEYTFEYLDEQNLLQVIRKAFSGPVFNMKQPGSGSRLLRILEKIN